MLALENPEDSGDPMLAGDKKRGPDVGPALGELKQGDCRGMSGPPA